MESQSVTLPIGVASLEEPKSFVDLINYWKSYSEKKVSGKEEPKEVWEEVAAAHTVLSHIVAPQPLNSQLVITNPFSISYNPYYASEKPGDLKKQVLKNEHLKRNRHVPVPPSKLKQERSRITVNDVEEMFGLEEPSKPEIKGFKKILLRIFR
ncbi:hypothetical protein BY458DRAFT_585816 [Sporodiniella umbellata]|nr:hypothetical protein BY458DRAFT_585816 [Sporodiniella umbellata]